MLLTYGMFVLANLILMAEPYFLGLVFNTIQAGGDDLFRRVLSYLTIYSSLAFFFWIFHGTARVLEREISYYISKKYNEEMFGILTNLPLKWHKNYHTGQLMSRVKKSSGALSRFTDESYLFIETIVKFAVSLIMIFVFLPEFAFVAILFGVFIVIVTLKFDKRIVKNLHEINERNHRIDSTYYDYISNIRTVITLRLQELAKKELVQKILNIFPILKSNILTNELKWFTISMGLVVMNFMVLTLYIYDKISAGEAILIGSLTALYQYVSRFMEVFYRVAGQYEKLTWFNTDIKAVKPIRDEYEKVLSKETLLYKNEMWHNIRIKNLFFKYEDEKHGAHHLNNLHIDLKPGLRIAFVGESGSGKSTFLSLLRGLDDADKVDVEIDGDKFKDLKVISGITTLIPQDPEIFENSIEYNISAGVHHHVSEVEHACELAKFDSVLKKLPEGLNTNIKEKGVNLSGGEKQRLALARGFFAAKNSSIILLDEPTSSVDSKNELVIYKNLFYEFKDACIISSIHHLHLLKMFDLVYLFEKGEIAGIGSFDELLESNEHFKKMWEVYKESVQKD